jgi:hypothetical protein
MKPITAFIKNKKRLDQAIADGNNLAGWTEESQRLEGKINNALSGLAENVSDYKKEKNSYVQSSKIKPTATIIFDDGYVWDYTIVKPYFDSLGIVANTAMLVNKLLSYNPGNGLSNEQLLALEEAGWGILSHTMTHIDCSVADETTLRTEFKQSYDAIKAIGIKTCDYIVYPFNRYSPLALEVVKDYYKGAFGKNEPTNDLGNFYNTAPVNQYAMYRFDLSTDCRADIDKAIADNALMVFMGHSSQYGDPNNTQAQKDAYWATMTTNIQYLITKGIPILNVNDAMDIFGNVLTIGDHKTSTNKFMLSKTGKVLETSDLTNVFTRATALTGVTSTTPITSFERNKVTVKSFLVADNTGFPVGGNGGGGAGTLVTYRTGFPDNLNYQIWYPFNDTNRMYVRSWNVTNIAWNAWSEFNSLTTTQSLIAGFNSIAITNTGITNDTPPSTFPSGKISTTSFLLADATNLPYSNAGILITYRVNTANDTLNFQLWYPYNSNRVYKRYGASSSAWQAWERLNTTLALTTTERTALSSTTLVGGELVFDKTLNKPVWRNTNNTGWIDGIGCFSFIPASSTSPGNKGDFSANANYLYVCYATDSWIRIPKDTVAW